MVDITKNTKLPDLFWVYDEDGFFWMLCSATNTYVLELWPDLSHHQYTIEEFTDTFDYYVTCITPTR